jgi:hypothetical protein
MAPNLNPLLGGGGRIRTYEGISQQIYSLPPLAAWVPLHKMSRVFCVSHPRVSMSNEHLGGAGADVASTIAPAVTSGDCCGAAAPLQSYRIGSIVRYN